MRPKQILGCIRRSWRVSRKCNAKFVFLLFLVFLVLFNNCQNFECNYKVLSNQEFKTIENLNYHRNRDTIDTIFNDPCLKGYLQIHIREKKSGLEIENEIKIIMDDLKAKRLNRDIWVFNNKGDFLKRFFLVKDDLFESKKQYVNQ